MLELGSGRTPGGCATPDVALGAVGILYSSLLKHSEAKPTPVQLVSDSIPGTKASITPLARGWREGQQS